MELNRQTKKKIDEVKEMILNKIELKEIVKLKFNTTTKKNTWLKNNKKYFTPQELLYLEFIEVPELIEVEEENNQINVLSLATVDNIENLTLNQRMSVLMSNETLKAIQSLMNSQVEQTQETQIPLEYLRLNDIKVKNCRISDSIYNELVKYCNRNNLTITSVLNYIIDSFLKTKK